MQEMAFAYLSETTLQPLLFRDLMVSLIFIWFVICGGLSHFVPVHVADHDGNALYSLRLQLHWLTSQPDKPESHNLFKTLSCPILFTLPNSMELRAYILTNSFWTMFLELTKFICSACLFTNKRCYTWGVGHSLEQRQTSIAFNSAYSTEVF